jgi:threonine dehydratase
VLVKHENHLPTNAFKARNAMSLMTALSPEQRTRGVIAATRGNHGAGLAWAGQTLGVPVVICVPVANNPEKNAAMVGFGAELIEVGRDYDEAAQHAARLAGERGLHVAHSTNDPNVIAGAATLFAEVFEQAAPDACVVAVGGGSQAVGAIVASAARPGVIVASAARPGVIVASAARPGVIVASAARPGVIDARRDRDVPIFGVQAAGASAAHDSWHAKQRLTTASANTFADGLATRSTYDATWPALRDGLAGFVAVPDDAIASAIRMLMRTTHNLAEGAGAAGLAGLIALREQLAGKTVAIVLSGSNIDAETLRGVLG